MILLILSTKFVSFWFLFCSIFLFVSTQSDLMVNECRSERKIYSNQTSGTITNIDDQHERFCEWLITTEPSSSLSFINLRFRLINLNCSNEKIYIFDGDSYEDQLIANLDGTHSSEGQDVFASSGSMLIMHFSEIPMFSSKFTIEFTINECPLNCSSHGMCQNNRCICDKPRTGIACQFESCPDNCSKSGTCTALAQEDSCILQTEYYCDCPSNVIGQSCNTDLDAIEISRQMQWRNLFDNDRYFSARASHSSVYDELTGTIYTYGGRNYEAIYSDLLSYNLLENKWSNLTNCDHRNQSSSRPEALWAHSLNIINGSLILFGGIRPNGSFSNELWIYDLYGNQWHRPEIQGNDVVPGLAFHVAVIVDQKWLYVHGGRLRDSTFSSAIYRTSIVDGYKQWQSMIPLKGKAKHRQIAAHTAVFHDRLRSIVLFGGMTMSGGRSTTKLLNAIHLYNVDQNIWTTLNSIQNHPSERAFHSMLLIHNHLLLFGGYTNEEQCRDNQVYIYSLTCHQWINFDDSTIISSFPFDGLFSQSLVYARRQNLLLVLGGFSHNVHHQIWSIALSDQFLSSLSGTSGQHCQGLCPRLDNCFDCLMNGPDHDNILADDQVINESCVWNIKNQACTNYRSQLYNEIDYAMHSNDCRRPDFGLTLLKYYHSPNFSFPDEVSIVNGTSIQTSFNEAWYGIGKKREKNCGNCSTAACQLNLPKEFGGNSLSNMARILGFIHPLGLPSNDQNTIRIYLRSTSPEVLFSSKNSSANHLIKSNSSDHYQSSVDLWLDIGQNFFIDFIIKFPIHTVMDPLNFDTIDLSWQWISKNSSLSQSFNPDLVPKPFQDENLCHFLSTCNACLANAACVWCSSMNLCVIRDTTLSGCDQNHSSIIMEPEECFQCYEANHCEQCVSYAFCEWLHRHDVCVRRGRFNDSIINDIRSCPTECHLRNTLKICLDGAHNDCVWCQSTEQCIKYNVHDPLALYEFCNQQSPPTTTCYAVDDGDDCPMGSFRDRTTLNVGCQPCSCNSHGDQSKGVCNPKTGACYCVDYTEGMHCDRCVSGYYGDPKHGGHCFLQCSTKALIPNAIFGHFGFHFLDHHSSRLSRKIDTDAHVHCLWIFSSMKSDTWNISESESNPLMPIQINLFRSMNIDCAHSTLMIYDGIPDLINHQNKSNLLISTCSNQDQGQKLIAQSGIATVLFISDDLKQGFNASYQVIDRDRSLIMNSSEMIWPRNPHTMHYHEDYLIFVGGHFDVQHLPLRLFSLKHHGWIVANQKPRKRLPSNRYLHASTLIGNKLYVYGGLRTHSNRISNEFWCAFITENPEPNHLLLVWINLTFEPNPALVGHTLTPIQFDGQPALFLAGGYSPDHGYFSKQLIYIIGTNRWQPITTKGQTPIGIMAHSSVYHQQTNTIHLFGGIDFKESQKMVISNALYALNLTSRVWHRIQPTPANPVPPIYLHTAGGFQNYMVVFGGQTPHNFSSNIRAYFYKCNQWILFNLTAGNQDGSIASRQKSTAFHNNTIYVFETGSNGIWSIETIGLPEDVCNLYSKNRNRCLSLNGCSYCMLASNKSGHCFDDLNQTPEHCLAESISRTTGKCTWKKECNQFTNCVDCIAGNYENEEDGGCQWCADCHLANGRCMKMNDTCQWEPEFDLQLSNHPITICGNVSLVEADQCPSHRCSATDCHKCLQLNDQHDRDECIWTKQVYKFIRFGQAMPTNPIFDWACIESTIIKFSVMKNVPTIPPLECPPRCSQFDNCRSCLEESTGDESGSHECVWSELTSECMSPTYSLLKCQSGIHCGGFLYRRTQSQCPEECDALEKASDCLQMLHCGWCAIEGLDIDGVGSCLKGGLFGPTLGKVCTNQSMELFDRAKRFNVPIESLNAKWHYLNPPQENECLNKHHTCEESSQVCIDLVDGFMCRCKDGYKMLENVCKPICQHGCIHGVCIAPNVCRCHFGFIGEDCGFKCQCHGHSTCPSAQRLDECIQCHNDTQGRFCDQCKPFYVGQPFSAFGQSCRSCFEYCHEHSNLCFSEELLANASTKSTQELDDDYWLDFGSKIKHGPTDKTVCVNCRNNTDGERCDRCKLGFFKISNDIRDGCRSCMCNGHGSICNPFNGENCNCHNNTENDRQCNYLNSKEYSNYINKTYFFKSSQIMTTYSLPCWMLQCAKCREYFYGTPTNGHQCYRHMHLEKEYCLDPVNQENCLDRPTPLLNGRTVFFGLQPRYMNVDMKLIVYSIQGKIDLFLASREDMFVVEVDSKNGFHHVLIDKKYTQSGSNISSLNHDDFDNNSYVGHQLLSLENDDMFDGQNVSLKSPYKLSTKNLDGEISSYFIVKTWYEVVILRNLRNRLELTIPYKNHDLRTTRFYLMIRGNWLPSSDANYGFVMLRQDQNRIDLFIFFCVFLCFFFVFLCISVFVWRLKQIVNLYRSRHRQEIELEQMANRPFSTITVLMDHEERAFQKISTIGQPLQCTPSKKESSFLYQFTIGFKDPPRIYPENPVYAFDWDRKRLMRPSPWPVSIEPTIDGQAAIMTTLIRLPSEPSSSTMQIAAASTLVQNCPSIMHKMNTNNYKLADRL